MSLGVTGAFSNINAVQRLNAEELRLGISGEASWHHQYRDSCYIYIRVPRGFGFLGYEDQRSTILAVDNANGMKLLQRTLRVDHCKDFRPPTSGKDGEKESPYQPTGAEGGGIGKHLITKREKELHKSRMQQQKLQQQRHQRDMALAAAGSKDVDEMWAEEFEMMLSQLNDEADAEMSALIKQDKKLKKKLKKEKKLLKKEERRRSSSKGSRSRSNSRSRSKRRHGGGERNKERDEESSRHRSREREEESTGQADPACSVKKEGASLSPSSSRGGGRRSNTKEERGVKEERSDRSHGRDSRERDSRRKSSRNKRDGSCERGRDGADTHRRSRRSRSRERSGRASRRSRSS
ncbi:hypothetical protein ACSSS7_006087 [Eimeria intestinalis]